MTVLAFSPSAKVCGPVRSVDRCTSWDILPVRRRRPGRSLHCHCGSAAYHSSPLKANQSSTFEKTGAPQDVGWGQTTSRPESSVAAAVDPSNRFARRLAQRLLQRLGHNFCLKAVRQSRTNPIHAVSKMMRARAECCMVLARKAATVPRLLNSHR
jgi:hypothetical protein